ncbi:MAG: DNA polymerase IV, partial [Clostridium sp.]
FSDHISDDLAKRNLEGRTITVKYKSSDFESHTRSKTLNYYTNKKEDFYKVCEDIINGEDFRSGIRLIGLTISSFKEGKIEQMTLF